MNTNPRRTLRPRPGNPIDRLAWENTVYAWWEDDAGTTRFGYVSPTAITLGMINGDVWSSDMPNDRQVSLQPPFCSFSHPTPPNASYHVAHARLIALNQRGQVPAERYRLAMAYLALHVVEHTFD